MRLSFDDGDLTMNWRVARLDRLSAEDERILALERGSVAGHVCKVLVLDGQLDAARLRRTVRRRMASAPRLRQRLTVLPRGFGRPVWSDDPAFDLRRHIRAADAGPVDDAGLRALAASLMEERLDRDRPLWCIDVARLMDGRTALLWRVHHCMADGFTAMRIGAACIWKDNGGDTAVSATTTARCARTVAALAAARRCGNGSLRRRDDGGAVARW